MEKLSEIFTPEEIQRIIDNEKLVKAVISEDVKQATQFLCQKYYLFRVEKALKKIGNDAHEKLMKMK